MEQMGLSLGEEPHVFTVSDLNKEIRSQLEGQFPLIWLKGEISNFKPHSSGHWYFSLKDSKAQVNAVMFRGFNQSVKCRPTDGMEVLIRGKVTVYEPRGNYQVFCEVMEAVGAGALQMAFEKLKSKLQAEGLFAQERKRALPKFPRHVAVVTSPTGAAIRDILHVLERRFAGLRVTLVPAVVQGEQAPQSIVTGLQMASRLKDVDVMIVGRGGGSIEDLWCFNDERVARAIAASPVPTISAVGHEIDFTIADFVADVRAPTPSAAAEIVVQSAAELKDRVTRIKQSLLTRMGLTLQMLKRQLQASSQRLIDPKRRLQDLSQRCDELTSRLALAMDRGLERGRTKVELLRERLGTPDEMIRTFRQTFSMLMMQVRSQIQVGLDRKKARLGQSAVLLDSLSPLRVLDRGYAIAKLKGQILKDAAQVKVGDEVEVRLGQGQISTTVTQVITQEKP